MFYDISAFFQLSTKLSILVIWRNYRQNYRYKKWQENYQKNYRNQKNYLSYTPTKGAKILTNTNLSGQNVIFDILAASASGKYSILEVWGPSALRASWLCSSRPRKILEKYHVWFTESRSVPTSQDILDNIMPCLALPNLNFVKNNRLGKPSIKKKEFCE